MRRKRITWNLGDIFGVKLPNYEFALLQAVDLFMPNWIYVAILNKKIGSKEEKLPALVSSDIISLIAISREVIDFGEFILLGSHKLLAKKSDFKNEQFKDKNYVGAVSYDGGLASDFLAAYHKLVPWDDWGDPDFLNKLLINQESKPDGLVYLKNRNSIK